jgi:tetratricopeptide (TPR) repeat protein
MKNKALAFLIVGLVSLSPAMAQKNDWTQYMIQAKELEHAGKYGQAIPILREAVKVAENSGPDTPLLLPPTLNELGLSYEALGLYNDARSVYERSLAVLEAAKGGRENVDSATTLANLAAIFLHSGQPERGEKLIREAIAIYTRCGPSDGSGLALARLTLSESLLQKGDWVGAEPLIEQAFAVFEKAPEEQRVYFGMTLNNLGVVRERQGKHREAATLLRRGLSEMEKATGPNHPFLIEPLNNLGSALTLGEEWREAEECFKRAIAIAELQVDSARPTYGQVMLNYAELLRRRGRKREAERLQARSREVQKESALKNGAGMTVDVSSFRAREK